MAQAAVAENAAPLPIIPVLTPIQEVYLHAGEVLLVTSAIGTLTVMGAVEGGSPKCPEQLETIAEMSAEAATGRQITVEDFEEIFTRFQTPLTNFVYRMVGNREEANDLVQDAFVKAYRSLAGGTTIAEGAFTSWLYRIAANTATDTLRRRKLARWVPLSIFNEDRGIGAGLPVNDGITPAYQEGFDRNPTTSPESPFHSKDGGGFEDRVADSEIIQAVLNTLPPKYVTCLLLYEHEGYSCAEISEMLNISASAVKMRLKRGRKLFIDTYQQITNSETYTPPTQQVRQVAMRVRGVLEQHNVVIVSGRRKNTSKKAS